MIPEGTVSIDQFIAIREQTGPWAYPVDSYLQYIASQKVLSSIDQDLRAAMYPIIVSHNPPDETIHNHEPAATLFLLGHNYGAEWQRQLASLNLTPEQQLTVIVGIHKLDQIWQRYAAALAVVGDEPTQTHLHHPSPEQIVQAARFCSASQAQQFFSYSREIASNELVTNNLVNLYASQLNIAPEIARPYALQDMRKRLMLDCFFPGEYIINLLPPQLSNGGNQLNMEFHQTERTNFWLATYLPEMPYLPVFEPKKVLEAVTFQVQQQAIYRVAPKI